MIETSQLLITFLINSMWQIPLVAAIAALCARLVRHTPSAYRHFVWVAALGLCLGLPLTSLRSSTDAGGNLSLLASQAGPDDSARLGPQKLAGGISVCSFNMRMEGTRQVINIVDKTLTESFPIRNLGVSGKSLSFDWKDPDGDEDHLEFEEIGTDAGRLNWVGLPNDLELPSSYGYIRRRLC
jgi:hypothetical protein